MPHKPKWDGAPRKPLELSADDRAFLRAVAEAGDDVRPRLVYADWLMDRGRDPEAWFWRWAAHVRCRPWQKNPEGADHQRWGWYGRRAAGEDWLGRDEQHRAAIVEDGPWDEALDAYAAGDPPVWAWPTPEEAWAAAALSWRDAWEALRGRPLADGVPGAP